MLSRNLRVTAISVLSVYLVLITKYFIADIISLMVVVVISLIVFMSVVFLLHKYISIDKNVKNSDLIIFMSYLVTLIALKFMVIEYQLVMLHVAMYIVIYCLINYKGEKHSIKPEHKTDINISAKKFRYRPFPFVFNATICCLFIVPLLIVIVQFAIEIRDIYMTCFMMLFGSIALSPIFKIVYTFFQTIYIDNDGVSMTTLLGSRYIKWNDVDKVELKSVLSSFTKSRFDKPEDLVIHGSDNKTITIISYINDYKEIVEILENKGLLR